MHGKSIAALHTGVSGLGEHSLAWNSMTADTVQSAHVFRTRAAVQFTVQYG